MEVEQRYVIKFFFEEGMKAQEICDRLQNHYHENALKLSAVYKWIGEVKCGRNDLSDLEKPGRLPDESLDPVIAARYEMDPSCLARKIARSLGIALSTVCRCFTEVLGLSYPHLRWIPHTLTPAQKVARVEIAKRMLGELAKHQASNFHFIYTGDESWFLDEYQQTNRWVPVWDDTPTVVRPSHRQ
jgi:transposase